jgi:hypothetical protein
VVPASSVPPVEPMPALSTRPNLRLPSLSVNSSSPAMRPQRPNLSLQQVASSSSNVVGGDFEHPYIDPYSSASSSVSQLQDSALTGSTTGSPHPKNDPETEMKDLEEHLQKLTLSLNGKEPDVEDLDVDGWRAVSRLGRIENLSELGEGAGGAVTRCMLKGGKTIFALKVSSMLLF